jgi:hypothetical protein
MSHFQDLSSCDPEQKINSDYLTDDEIDYLYATSMFDNSEEELNFDVE